MAEPTSTSAERDPETIWTPPEAFGGAPGRARLAGRTILVVGAGSQPCDDADAPTGNGRAISLLAAREGARIAQDPPTGPKTQSSGTMAAAMTAPRASHAPTGAPRVSFGTVRPWREARCGRGLCRGWL